MENRRAALDRLDAMGIAYELQEHPAVYTIEEMEALGMTLDGETVVKNLFLRDGKGRRHFLVMVRAEKTVNLKALSALLGVSQLGFASEERLLRYLGLTKGAVSPLGLLNDTGAAVVRVVDADLVGNPRLGVHPNDNTATVWMTCADIERVAGENGNEITVVKIAD